QQAADRSIRELVKIDETCLEVGLDLDLVQDATDLENFQYRYRRQRIVCGYREPPKLDSHQPSTTQDIESIMQEPPGGPPNPPHVKVRLGHTARLLPDSPAVSSQTRHARVCVCGLETAEPRSQQRCYADRDAVEGGSRRNDDRSPN